MKLYTFGYQGAHLSDLVDFCCKGATIIDTRLSPTSPSPLWRKRGLTEDLRDQYRSVPAFGNINYRLAGAPIEIRDYERGREEIRPLIEAGTPLVLLCCCANVETCHRKVVAEKLAADFGLEVNHLRVGEVLL